MTQTTILAAGNDEATSTDIVVAADGTVKVGIFSADGGTLPRAAAFTILEDTPGGDNRIGILTDFQRSFAIAGPGTYRVKRDEYEGRAFGVFLES